MDNSNVEWKNNMFKSHRYKKNIRINRKTRYYPFWWSTNCFKHDIQFQRSDIHNAYHQFIQDNYGISIETSSVHINIGINDLDKLFSAIRLIRSEAALYLSLSASSPFLNNKITTNHSQRWIQFPKTPSRVPFFVNHNSYIVWKEENISNKNMQNIRHFWSSIRPNGPQDL